MNNWKLWMAALFTVVAIVALACTDDNGDDTDGDGTTPEATEAPAENGEEPADGEEEGDGNGGGGGGSAALAVGDQTWTFDEVFCAFSPEESQNARVSFTLSSFGESDTGARIQLDATIQDPDEEGRYEGDNVIHSLSVDDVDDFENPSVSLSAMAGLIGETDNFIQVDGNNVTAETTFDDGTTDEIEEIPGTLEATCP